MKTYKQKVIEALQYIIKECNEQLNGIESQYITNLGNVHRCPLCNIYLSRFGGILPGSIGCKGCPLYDQSNYLPYCFNIIDAFKTIYKKIGLTEAVQFLRNITEDGLQMIGTIDKKYFTPSMYKSNVFEPIIFELFKKYTIS